MVMAAALLGALWFVRARLARDAAEHPRLDGARYLRDIAPMLRRAGCTTVECHGRAGASLHLSPTLSDAADAVREFHAMREAAPRIFERVTGRGHPATLSAGSCEARALKLWSEGRAAPVCQSGGPQVRVVR